jgi:hypothetical protein
MAHLEVAVDTFAEVANARTNKPLPEVGSETRASMQQSDDEEGDKEMVSVPASMDNPLSFVVNQLK